jgi:hypothetical protein
MKGYSMNFRDWSIKYSDAVQQPDGSWLLNDGTTYWYDDEGIVHRTVGPAIIGRNTKATVSWCLHGKPYTFKEWCNKVSIPDEQKLLLRLQYDE